ncbi:hypothetical protein BerOc1_01681 [Pseudodesulfovibrio hydrargyri]|uniref:Uncharacterized protein n=1 Tax=Pseudodesulfovibrio hydrargyri TaxID=2125990 RepID=A0A1J5MVC5_9BACT|nr:ATP-binding protein [Pseudodesulfovibrio hydrargyri]OIQ49756.1 hypothetical protein BerOc1_01681 [Pseudodesulfovibrio hydrargyri]
MLEVSKEEIVARLSFIDNPWWESSARPEDWQYNGLPYRAYFKAFYSRCTQKKVRRAAILMGPRRVGKTVMLHQVIHKMVADGWNAQRILFASIDTPIYTGMGLEQFVGIVRERQSLGRNDEFVVFFDEIQYLKDWEIHLKSLVDSYPNAKFIASGSAAAALKVKSHESGAGRFSDFMLPPLTFAEYLSFIGREEELVGMVGDELEHLQEVSIGPLNEEFVTYLNVGGYPEAVASLDVREGASQFIRRDIIDKALLRDLPSLYGINDVQELYRLFTVVAYNSGSEFNLDGLSKAAGVKKDTIKRYLNYLEAAFLIMKVCRVDETGKAFKRERGFKLYLTNPSIRAALFQPVGPDDDPMGCLTETAIFSQWFHARENELLRYARWKGGEVDIVQLNPATLRPTSALEVKWSDLYFRDSTKLGALRSFTENTNISALATTRTALGITRDKGFRVAHVPSSFYCYWVGKKGIEQKVTQLAIL